MKGRRADPEIRFLAAVDGTQCGISPGAYCDPDVLSSY